MRRGVLLVATAVALAAFASACAKLDSNSRRTETRAVASTPQPRPNPVEPRRYGGAANYITNPSFEKGVAPWQPWRDSSVEITRAAGMIGQAAARVTTKSATHYGIVYPNAVNSPAGGDSFALSVWVKSADRRKKIAVLLQGGRPNGQLVVVADTAREISPVSWRRITVRGRVHAGDLYGIDVYLRVLKSIGYGDGFLVDAASLKLVQ